MSSCCPLMSVSNVWWPEAQEVSLRLFVTSSWFSPFFSASFDENLSKFDIFWSVFHSEMTVSLFSPPPNILQTSGLFPSVAHNEAFLQLKGELMILISSRINEKELFSTYFQSILWMRRDWTIMQNSKITSNLKKLVKKKFEKEFVFELYAKKERKNMKKHKLKMKITS